MLCRNSMLAAVMGVTFLICDPGSAAAGVQGARPGATPVLSLMELEGSTRYRSSMKTSPGEAQDLTRLHKYLGYSTLVSGGLAALTGADESGHKALGVTAVSLALATFTTGLIQHRDWFDVSNGFSDHNIHIVLGSIAAVGFGTTAVLGASGNETHTALGPASLAAASIGVALIRW